MLVRNDVNDSRFPIGFQSSNGQENVWCTAGDDKETKATKQRNHQQNLPLHFLIRWLLAAVKLRENISQREFQVGDRGTGLTGGGHEQGLIEGTVAGEIPQQNAEPVTGTRLATSNHRLVVVVGDAQSGADDLHRHLQLPAGREIPQLEENEEIILRFKLHSSLLSCLLWVNRGIIQRRH